MVQRGLDNSGNDNSKKSFWSSFGPVLLMVNLTLLGVIGWVAKDSLNDMRTDLSNGQEQLRKEIRELHEAVEKLKDAKSSEHTKFERDIGVLQKQVENLEKTNGEVRRKP